jgi:hypothetical protein
MSERKNFSDEMLKEYISSEILIIEKEKDDKSNWKLNQDFNSQISIRMEGE